MKSALLYLNQQTAAPTPVQYPELFLDDVVVQVTDPPASAPAGCKLTQAAVYLQQEGGTCGADGGIECPDLYVDDVAITVAP